MRSALLASRLEEVEKRLVAVAQGPWLLAIRAELERVLVLPRCAAASRAAKKRWRSAWLTRGKRASAAGRE